MKSRPCIPLFASAILLFSVLQSTKAQQVVFQADFNGSGGGTGGASDLVTFGGTGTLLNSTNLSGTIVNSGSLFPPYEPGCLRLVVTGSSPASSGGGVTLRPSSGVTSPDSWLAFSNTTFDAINGGIDFYFIDSEASGTWSGDGGAFRPIDINGGNGGLRFIINAPTLNRLQAQLIAYSTSGSAVQVLTAVNSSVNVAAGRLYHLAVTASTGTTGYVTLKLFLAPGDTRINPASNAYLIGSGTGTNVMPSGTGTINHAFSSTNGFAFGQSNYNSGSADDRTMYFGSLRIYDNVPGAFSAVAYLPGLTLNTPNPEPSPFPANFDLFTPPFTSGTVATGTNAPAGGEWTRTGNSGDGLVISGRALSVNSGSSSSLGDDSNFVIYGESGTALLSTRANIRRLEGVSGTTNSAAAIELDQNLPNDAMYVVWPENAGGTGTPMVVNQAEAWWVGWNQASPGTTASVYGRNLTYGLSGTVASGLSGTSIIANGAPAADQSWVYLVGGGTAYRATVTAANPYKVDFTVPSVATGVPYQVWVHNGHGGHYGWSMCPGALTPSTPYAWSATLNGGTLSGSYIDITQAPYNADTTGTVDDGTAFNHALAAAGSGTGPNTIYFPAGTYLIKESGTGLQSNTQLVGSGTGTSELLAGANGITLVSGYFHHPNNIRVTNLVLNSGTCESTYLINTPCINTGSGQSTSFTNLTLIGSDTTTAWFPTSTTVTTITVANSSTVTVSGTSGIQVGGTVSGTSIGIPAGTVVDAINGTKVTLGNPATVSGSGSAVYSGTVLEPIGQTQGMVYLAPSDNVFFESCTVTGGGWDAQQASQCFLDHVTMNCMFNPSLEMELDVAPNDVSFTNCTAQSYEFTPGGSWSGTYGSGWGFVKQDNGGGASGNIYFGGNSTIMLSPLIQSTNWGQQIDIEGDSGFFYGTPVSASGTTMTFNTGSMTAQGFVAGTTYEYQTGTIVYYYQLSFIASIINGTGMGQSRMVVSDGYTGTGGGASFTGTVTIDSPWNVPPDSTSTVVLGMYVRHEAFYENSFQGSGSNCTIQALTTSTGTPDSGVLAYGGVLDLVVDSNSFDQLGTGMVDEFPQGQRTTDTVPATHMSPNFFHLIIGNTGTAGLEGIYEAVNSSTGTIPATYGFGHVYRGNNISNNAFAGFSAESILSQPSTSPPRDDMVLVDTGTITGCPTGAYFGYPQVKPNSQGGKFNTGALGNTIFTRDSVKFLTGSGAVPPDPGTVLDTEGYAMYWPSGTDSPSPDIALNNNSYQFDGTYTGTFSGTYIGSNYTTMTPGAVLEIPQRTFGEAGNVVTLLTNGTVTGTSAPSVGDTMVILSNGAEPLVWTASSSAPWLTVSPPTGTISSENGSGTATFACNPLLAGTGTFTGTIAYTNVSGTVAGTPVKTATVTFIVNSATNP